MHHGPPSDHFDGKRFFNPSHPVTDRGMRDLLRWRREGERARWPESVPVTPAVPERGAGLRITMVGHSSLLIQSGEAAILTDPVWSRRASPLSFAGPARVTEPGIRFDDLPPITAVLLTHNHYDHMDLATLRRLEARFAPVFAVPLGNDRYLRRFVPQARIKVGDWYDDLALGAGIGATLTPAYHWSSRRMTDRRRALWAGYHVTLAGRSVWYAGDTAYGSGAIFAEIRQRLAPIDVALIPIGAYEPRWFMSAQHVNPDEAVQIFRDVGAAAALGIHWGTFQLTDEAREAPVEHLAQALASAGIGAGAFRAAHPGEAYDFSGPAG